MEDYTALLPLMPPEGILEWKRAREALSGHLLAYEKVYVKDPITELKKVACRCVCSACREEFNLDYVSGGNCHRANNTYGCRNYLNGEVFGDYSPILCPECGAKVTAKRFALIRDYHYAGGIRPTTVHVLGKDMIAFASWIIERRIYRDMRIETVFKRDEAYVLHKKKLIRCKGYATTYYDKHWLDHWEQFARSDDCSGSISSTDVYGFHIDQLKGTLWENSKLDLYFKTQKDRCRPILYMRTFAQYPNIENLVTSPGAYLLGDIYKKYHRGYGKNPAPKSVTEINYREARPAQMLRLNKDEFRYFAEQKAEWSVISFYRDHRALLKPEEMMEIKELSGYGSLISRDYPCNIVVAARYLLKQIKKRRDYYTASVSYLHDYWRMLLQVDGVITPENRYPQNLKNAHDAVSRRIEQAKKDERELSYIKRRERLERFSWQSEGLFIRAVRDDDELYMEGKTLSHCVYSYADKHCSGGTAIMVIRHADKPEEPYFTLELDEKSGSVRQNRGLRNCARTEEVEKFEAAWIKHVRDILKKEKKNGKRDDAARGLAIAGT